MSDALDGQLSSFVWTDEVPKGSRRSDVSVRSSGLVARGWLSSLQKITTTAKEIGSAVKGTASQIANAVQTSKDLLLDFTGLASDARSATTAIKEKAQEAITNISFLPTNILMGLKDETKDQLEKTLGSLTQKVSNKLPTIGGLDTVVSDALIHLSATALNKLEDVADAQIAKLNATRSHVAENINNLFEAPANSINSFLTDVEEVYLKDLTNLADEYATKTDGFCDILGKYIDAVQSVENAANGDWTDINNAAKEISSLVISFTDAQDRVVAAEMSSGLPEESRITVSVFTQLSDERIGWLKTYMTLQVKLMKRDDPETETTVDVIKRILEQQGEDTDDGDDDDDDC
ncbi:hypothetical protein N7510_000109 [Penicillium lagena]|uniref:uncharacterized protein n=1 Tax=Penicillium lagena TaxID=94218 RepID=UPI0025420E1A|nr:uncharacterized protein N7510_000109 [Penicillium lagena]KAJ5623800.1 hypothetical protein N7510_000109 [Penicillium lagena]